MLIRTALLLIALFPLVARAGLTDEEARRVAVDMDRTISQAKADLNRLVAKGARDQYRAVRTPVAIALDSWPAQHLSNRAAFPYFDCAQAARSFLQYGDAWSRNDQQKGWRDRVANEFRQSHTACQAAIEKPDMSLKDIK